MISTIYEIDTGTVQISPTVIRDSKDIKGEFFKESRQKNLKSNSIFPPSRLKIFLADFLEK